MKHLDLFSGIGGFALACQWNNIETICFCEIDKFCQKVLKKYWSNVPIVEDINNVEEIKQIITNTKQLRFKYGKYSYRTRSKEGIFERGNFSSSNPKSEGLQRYIQQQTESARTFSRCNEGFILTAGFPCQPFSNAGRKQGSSDDRYLWPQTLKVIESIKPNWIVLENVPGILNMVFPDSQVGVASQASFCEVPNETIADYDTISGRIESDLRQAGYETVWMVIPACSLSAPHRRDRVWIVGNSSSNGFYGTKDGEGNQERSNGNKIRQDQFCKSEGTDSIWSFTSGTSSNRSKAGISEQEQQQKRTAGIIENSIGERNWWSENWYEVATKFCRVAHGIPHRVDRLKALGNTIVPQVAYEIIKVIKETECRDCGI